MYYARYKGDGEIGMLYATVLTDDPGAKDMVPISEEIYNEALSLDGPTPEPSSLSLEDQLTTVIAKAKNTI